MNLERLTKFLLIVSVILVQLPLKAISFLTLKETQAYAAQFPEYVKPDNQDWLHPDYTSFHKENKPGLLRRVSSWFGFSYPVWDARKFKNVLKALVTVRERDELNGVFAEQYKPHKSDKCIIWGDLFGAFHSLVRDLTFLQEQGIINDQFKMIKPNYIFVFNGNVIDGSPYALETLTLVLRLLERNHSRVFYIRGYHEEKERWHNFGLAQDLKIRAQHVSREAIPLNDLLVRFFNTLPLALYLTHDAEKEIEAVLIANTEEAINTFDSLQASYVLSGNGKRRGFFKRTEEKQKEKRVAVKAYITSEDRSVTYHKTEGLTLLSSAGGVARWLLFSSPTEQSQKLYRFQYDAFAQLIAHNGIDSWTIGLFNQRVAAFDGFQESALYHVVSGWPIKMKNSLRERELYVGSTMDLSKGASPIGKKVLEGLELAFNREHTLNTIPGVIPEITTKDDEYTPIKTRSIVENMIKSGITTFIGSQGSPSLESYLDLIKEGKVLVLFPFTGAPDFRKPDLKYLIHYRGSYIREGQDLMDYAIKDMKAKKIAIFYQDDAFGRGALEGARQTLKEAGITNFIEVPHERNIIDYKKQAATITDFNPDTILFSTNTPAIRGLIRQMGVQYFVGKNLLGISVYEDAFERFLKDKGLTFTLIRVVPDPQTSELPIAREYRAWADQQNVPYDKVSFEQFINANIFFELLRMIDGPVTNEKIIEKAEHIKNYPFKGLLLNFNPETRELSDYLWLDTGKGDWILKSVKKDERVVNDEQVAVDSEEKREEKPQGSFRLATLTDFTKGTRQLGRAVQAGIELRFAQERSEGRTVPEIVFVDDQYTPAITRPEVDRLLKMGINTFLMPTGSPTLEVYLDLIKEGKILVLFPLSGAPIFRQKELTYVIHLRASYTDEGKALTEYALNTIHTKKLFIFYQNDAFGKGLLEAAKEVLRKNAIEWKAILYDRDEVNFVEQVRILETYDPDTIMFFSTATATKGLIRQMGVEKMRKKNMIGCSDLGEANFAQFMKKYQLSVIYACVVPNPATSAVPMVKQFRDGAKKKGIALDPLSLESYIASDLLFYVLSKINGRPTNQQIITQLEAIKDMDYKGILLNFDPRERTLIHSIWLDTGAPEWLQIPVG